MAYILVEPLNARFISDGHDLGRVGDLVPWWDVWISNYPDVVIFRGTRVSIWIVGLLVQIRSSDRITQDEMDKITKFILLGLRNYNLCIFA